MEIKNEGGPKRLPSFFIYIYLNDFSRLEINIKTKDSIATNIRYNSKMYSFIFSVSVKNKPKPSVNMCEKEVIIIAIIECFIPFNIPCRRIKVRPISINKKLILCRPDNKRLFHDVWDNI